MSHKRRVCVNVEGLETRVVPSGISPPVIVGPPPQLQHLVGSADGTWVTSPGTTATPAYSTIQLQGSGVVSPLGAVSLQGTITAAGGRLTLRCADSNATETVDLFSPRAITSGTDFVESFAYTTADGAYSGTFTLDLHYAATGGSLPSQFGTFHATFS